MRDFEGRRSTTGSRQEHAAAPERTPGKRTLTEMLPPAKSTCPVQRKTEAAPVLFGGAAVQRARACEVATDAPRAASTGSGQLMPEAVQRKMERAFGADFSAVRIHEGAQ